MWNSLDKEGSEVKTADATFLKFYMATLDFNVWADI